MSKNNYPSESEIMKMIKEESIIRKFDSVAPEGFVLVHEKTLEELKEFEKWMMWKNNDISIKEMNKNNFNNT